MTRVRVHQGVLGSWFVLTTAPLRVVAVYPPEMWEQAKDEAFKTADETRKELAA